MFYCFSLKRCFRNTYRKILSAVKESLLFKNCYLLFYRGQPFSWLKEEKKNPLGYCLGRRANGLKELILILVKRTFLNIFVSDARLPKQPSIPQR